MKSRNAFALWRKGKRKALNEWTDCLVAKLKSWSVDKWRLYWQPSDLKWHQHPGCSSSNRLDDLVQEIDVDSLACFFG